MLSAVVRSRSAFTPRSFLLAAAALGVLALAPGYSHAQTSRANHPFSGISPGGVDMSTGELILVMRPDLTLDGPFPVIYRRYYASLLASDGFASGPMGPNWLGTYDWTLSVVGGTATLVTNRGAVIRFTMSPASGSWDLVSPTYAKFRLDVLSGGTWRFTNPLDRRLYFFDGGTWRLSQVQDERGNALTLTYGAGGGPLAQVSDGMGRILNFTYDPGGQLAQVSDGTRAVHYSYTSGVLTGFIDAAGHVWAYASNPGPQQGLLVGVTEPLGNTPMTQTFDSSGRVASQTDAAGNIASYSYGGATGNMFTDPSSHSWGYQHDASGRLTSLLDPMGAPSTFAYDPLGRLSMATRPMGDLTSFSYDATSGYPSMVGFADGSSINWGYGSHLVGGATLFDLSTETFADGTVKTFGRDLAGNLTDLTDQAGNHWLGTYNARGQILTWTNPSGGLTTFTYDALGRPATCRDNAGNTASVGYDGMSRPTQVTWPGGPSRLYAYDALDQLTGITDERGKLWSYAWDSDQRLTAATNPLLEATGYAYDAVGRVTQVTDPLGHRTQYAYDSNGRVQTKTDRTGRVTSYRYDVLNRLTGVLDPAGGLDVLGWDSNGRMISAQDPMGHTASFGYDMLDRLTHATDPVGTGFDFGYDIMGRLRTATAPLGHSKSFNYDARGFLTSLVDGTSQTGYTRTVLGEISLVTDPNRNGWTRSYDAQGRLISAADPLGRMKTVEYDALSRPLHITRPDGSLLQIDYDAAGRVIGETFGAAGPSLVFGYDDAGRVTSATGASFAYDAAGRMTNSNGFAMTYDPEGRLMSEMLAPGKMVSYAYDSRGLLSQATDWMGGATSFSYDAARRLTGVTRPNGTQATYAYDAADRLTSAVEKNPGPTQISSIAITRDALGRAMSIARTAPLMPGQTMASSASFTYDPASQMNVVSHDPLGRMTADASRSFQWDGASRLTRYAAGADSPSFTYDAFGRILSSSLGSRTAMQAWNYGHTTPTNDDLQVVLPSRVDICVRAPSGLLLYRVDAGTGTRSYYHYDEAGNTAFLTNDAGSVVASYAYGPFGGVSALGLTAGNPYTYGAALGTMSLGAGSSGLWAINGVSGRRTYDDRTMRVISGNTTHSGGVKGAGPQDDEMFPDKYARVKVQFHWDREGTKDGVRLNPQPFPPSPQDWVALNPQPFPPDPADGVALNPQPFPPGPADWVALNPQPFPPAPGGDVMGPHPMPWVALNPQPFPPAPDGDAQGPFPHPWDPGDGPGLFSGITLADRALAAGPQKAPRAGDFKSVIDAMTGLMDSWRAAVEIGGGFYHGQWWGEEEKNAHDKPIEIPGPPRSPIMGKGIGPTAVRMTGAESIGMTWESGFWIDNNCDGNLTGSPDVATAPCLWCPRWGR